MRKPSKDSLINTILLHLKDKSQELLNLGVAIVFDPREVMQGLNAYKGHSLLFPRNSIFRVKSSPYFIVKGDTFYLSSKGRIEIIKRIIQEKKNMKKWDGKWRAVVFDIPEPHRHERNFLRKELKWMGFKELQHSVWIAPYDVEKELLCLLKLWHSDFKGDIRFLVIEKIVDDKDIRASFGL